MSEIDRLTAALNECLTANNVKEMHILKWQRENARLLATLEEIANDPGGYPAEEAFDEVREIARKALVNEQKP